MPLTRVTCNVQDASQMTGYAFSSTGDSLSNRLTCLGQSCTCWQWFVDFLPKRRPRLDFVHCATPCWLWVSFKQHCVSCLLCPLHKKNVFKGTGILLIMGQSLCVPCIPWEKYEANGLRKICCALPTWMKNTWVSTVFVRLERNSVIFRAIGDVCYGIWEVLCTKMTYAEKNVKVKTGGPNCDLLSFLRHPCNNHDSLVFLGSKRNLTLFKS